MKLPEKCFEWQVKGWKLGITLCPGVLMLGVWWDGNPISFALTLPFVHFWFEHDGGGYWRWDWTILRIVIGKQEFRTDLALNDWGLGISMHHTDDSTSGRSTSSASTASSIISMMTGSRQPIFAFSPRCGNHAHARSRRATHLLGTALIHDPVQVARLPPRV